MTRTRTIAFRLAAVVALVLSAATAHAADWASVAIRAGRRAIDIRAFEQSVERRTDVRFERAVAADIDRDGDIDVVASTNRGFLVWVNNGAGWLVPQRPVRVPRVESEIPNPAWHDDSRKSDETIQTDGPAAAVSAGAAPLSQDLDRLPLGSTAPLLRDPAGSEHAPRAPPHS